jgi:2'-5' RNA ligase
MTIETSLLIIPPYDVQAFAAPLRERFAPLSFAQGPAHLTLFYPFVPATDVAPTIEHLSSLCAGIPSFDVTLDRYGRFPGSVYLQPKDPSAIQSLHRRLLEAFPGHLPYQGAFGEDLIPHLTLAYHPGDSDALVLPPPASFTFTVDRLHLYAGDPELRAAWVPLAILTLEPPR